MTSDDRTDPIELEALFARRPQVIKPGLARIEAALTYLKPEHLLSTPTVLVGGTNGKGTTSGYLWQLTSALGLRVGLFTSPHLQRFIERIQVSDWPVSNELLVSELRRLQQEIPAEIYEPLSFFEINTLLALRVYARAQTDLNILEVGMGGRWDSTNVANPSLSIITSVGLDHQQWLGNTTSAIAREKAGIMRRGCPVLWGGIGAGDTEAISTLRSTANELGALFWEQGSEYRQEQPGVRVDLPGMASRIVPWPLKASGWPQFLKDNFAKAAAAFCWLLDTRFSKADAAGGPDQDIDALITHAVQAMDTNKVRIPPCMRGRFDHCTVTSNSGQGRQVLLDVCHNIDGAKALARGLRESGMINAVTPKLPGLVSILVDKDCDEILDILRQVLSPLVLFATSGERSWSAERLHRRHRDLDFMPNFAAAWSFPLDASATVICGSVHAVGEVTSFLGIPIT